MVARPDIRRRNSIWGGARKTASVCYPQFVLNVTPPERLVDGQNRPYFLWDSGMTLDQFRKGLADPDVDVRAYLVGKLEGLQKKHASKITGVRGKGLLLAVGFSSDIAEKLTLDCLQNGLIGNNVRPNAFRLAPPLTVSEGEMDEAVDIIDKAVARA